MGFNELKKQGTNSGTAEGGTNVSIASPLTAFGELLTAELTPVAQGDFVYSINPQVFTTSEFNGSSTTTADNMAEITSGTDPDGSATIQLRRTLKYRSGQGSLMRATALFDSPDSGNAQFVGCGNAESGYFIGYFGTNFGILHNQKASREIRSYQITSGVADGTVLTLTLNGQVITPTINGGNDIYQTAYSISKLDLSQVSGGGWLVDVIGDTVYFIAARASDPSNWNGVYSIIGGTIAGTWNQYQEAESATQDFTPQTSFNIDPLDGSGPSGMILDQSKGNIYEIAFQYLGFGNARFGIEDPETGKIFSFHNIKNSNNRTFPVLKNPSVNVLATSANIGGTTSKTLRCGSMAGYVQGKIVDLDPVFTKTFLFQVDTTKSVVAIGKVNEVFQGVSCYGEIDLLKITASNLSTGNAVLKITAYINETLTGKSVNFQNFDSNQSIMSIATGNESGSNHNNVFHNVTLTGTPVFEMTIGPNSTKTEKFDQIRFSVGKNQSVYIVAESTSGGINGLVSFTWFEQQ